MRRTITAAALFAAIMLTAGPVWAEQQTITLAVDKMVCASCPYIVKRTLGKVPGVSGVEVFLEKKSAVVTFDDAQTDVETLTKATASVGFPSKLRSETK